MKFTISGPFWVPLGLQNRWFYLGKTWFLEKFTFSILGVFWAPFWLHFSLFWGPWGLLGGLWGVLWVSFGCFWGPLGRSWGTSWGLLGYPGDSPGPAGAPRGGSGRVLTSQTTKIDDSCRDSGSCIVNPYNCGHVSAKSDHSCRDS